MRVWIDQDYCTGSGLCEFIEPRVFAIGDDGLARVRAAEVPPGCEDEVRDAAESCPGGCIRLEPRPLSRTYASFLPAPRKPADRGNDGRRARISFDRATRDAHGSGQLEPACETDLTRP